MSDDPVVNKIIDAKLELSRRYPDASVGITKVGDDYMLMVRVKDAADFGDISSFEGFAVCVREFGGTGKEI